jgi:hypothetical protein
MISEHQYVELISQLEHIIKLHHQIIEREHDPKYKELFKEYLRKDEKRLEQIIQEYSMVSDISLIKR